MEQPASAGNPYKMQSAPSALTLGADLFVCWEMRCDVMMLLGFLHVAISSSSDVASHAAYS